MGIVIGSLADLIFFWVVLSPSNSKEVAVFISLAILSINLDMVSTTLRKLTMTVLTNMLISQWKPVENVVSCIVGIILWKYIQPLSLVSVIIFMVSWVTGSLLILFTIMKGNS